MIIGDRGGFGSSFSSFYISKAFSKTSLCRSASTERKETPQYDRLRQQENSARQGLDEKEALLGNSRDGVLGPRPSVGYELLRKATTGSKESCDRARRHHGTARRIKYRRNTTAGYVQLRRGFYWAKVAGLKRGHGQIKRELQVPAGYYSRLIRVLCQVRGHSKCSEEK
jgi:hypothetical protein